MISRILIGPSSTTTTTNMQNNDSTVRAQSTFALRDESTNERMEVPWSLLDLIRYEYEKEKIKAAMEVDTTNDDEVRGVSGGWERQFDSIH